MSEERFFVSFSGGKDSHLSLWRAQREGLTVEALFTMLGENGDATLGHRLSRTLLAKQAECLGLPFFYASSSWSDYEEKFLAMLYHLRDLGFTGGIFGDIDLLPHREWVEKTCAKAGVTPYLPLWGEARSTIAREIIHSGFEAYLIVTKDEFLPSHYLGRRYDEALLRELEALEVDLCAEEGEFHTVVVNGPNYATPLPFRFGRVRKEEGYHILGVEV